MRTLGAIVVTLVLAGSDAWAQTDSPNVQPAAEATDAAVLREDPSGVRAAASTPAFLSALGSDFRTFVSSTGTIRTMGILGAGALAASPWDRANARAAQGAWSQDIFAPGKIGGNFLVHLAGGGGTYVIGRAFGNARLARFGDRLARAQIVSQAVVQAGKFAAQRGRPDGSNDHSLPSGHTASAFATAAVVHDEFGWKAGIPAFAFASYIGASRMAANRHYLSDVLLGAGVGIAAAHSVSMHVGRHEFALGVSPAQGGAAVVFTRR